MHKNLIGGEWVAGSKSQPNINPSDTRDVIGEYAQANVEQAGHAIAAASHAFRAWSVTTPQQRLKVGDARSTDTQVGPVVDQTQLEQDLEYVRIGQDEGANLLCGGEQPSDECRRRARLLLSARCFCGHFAQHAHQPRGDLRPRCERPEGSRLRRGVDVGERFRVWPGCRHCNHVTEVRCALQTPHAGRHGDGHLPTAGVDYHVPFGGRKGSSYGPREQGRYAAEFYTTAKTAYTNA